MFQMCQLHHDYYSHKWLKMFLCHFTTIHLVIHWTVFTNLEAVLHFQVSKILGSLRYPFQRFSHYYLCFKPMLINFRDCSDLPMKKLHFHSPNCCSKDTEDPILVSFGLPSLTSPL